MIEKSKGGDMSSYATWYIDTIRKISVCVCVYIQMREVLRSFNNDLETSKNLASSHKK